MSSKDENKKNSLMDLATLDDFARINPASIMAMSNSLHFHTLEHTFREAAQTAKTLAMSLLLGHSTSWRLSVATTSIPVDQIPSLPRSF